MRCDGFLNGSLWLSDVYSTILINYSMESEYYSIKLENLSFSNVTLHEWHAVLLGFYLVSAQSVNYYKTLSFDVDTHEQNSPTTLCMVEMANKEKTN